MLIRFSIGWMPLQIAFETPMTNAYVKLLTLAGLIALGGLGCSDKQDETVHRERKTHSEPTAPTDSTTKPADPPPTEPAPANP